MLLLHKILRPLAIAASVALLASASAYGKDRKTHIKHRTPAKTTIGLTVGKDFFLSTNKGKQRRPFDANTLSFNYNKPLSKKLKLEGGVKYSFLHEGISNKYNTPYKVALPIYVQYYFAQEQRRIRPYCGMGLQYNFNVNTATDNNQTHLDITQEQNQGPTKHISILFTQGITFEVNTKIQVSQSFHFIPDNNIKIIGIDLGLGYKLP